MPLTRCPIIVKSISAGVIYRRETAGVSLHHPLLGARYAATSLSCPSKNAGEAAGADIEDDEVSRVARLGTKMAPWLPISRTGHKSARRLLD